MRGIRWVHEGESMGCDSPQSSTVSHHFESRALGTGGIPLVLSTVAQTDRAVQEVRAEHAVAVPIEGRWAERPGTEVPRGAWRTSRRRC